MKSTSGKEEIYIAICDDEITDINYEKELLESVLSDFSSEIKWEIDTFQSPKNMLNADRTYNIVFLDIEMNGIVGLETAQALHRKSPMTMICFVTHHESYMDEALDSYAFRFWTKPIDRVKLIRAIEKALQNINAHKRGLSVTKGKNKVNIYFEDIIYIYHNGRFTHIVTTNGEVNTYDSFKKVVKQLKGDCFVETHASCYVNMNYVYDHNKHDIVCMYKGKRYAAFVSKRKYAAFNKRFKEWSCGLW